MKLFFYENVGPKALIKSDTNTTQSHADGALPGLRTRSKKARDHEFEDILEAELHNWEIRDLTVDHPLGEQLAEQLPGLRRE